MNNEKLLKITEMSFYSVYYFMIFALIITIISTIIVKDSKIRIILFLEILITGISSFMYYLFINNISKYFDYEKKDKDIDLSVVDRLRYKGWMFSTPLMLIVLCLYLESSTKVKISFMTILFILFLDYVMLIFGYLGEINIINRLCAMILGFIPFFIIFYIIFTKFIMNKFNLFNYVIFGIYFIIWTGYGVSYMFDEKIKNILTNIFDGIAKGIVAILLSISKIINI
jgi:bacteriorhodopsin